jgi:endonuclease-3 related protein
MILKEIYQKLYYHFGKQYWWPGDTPFEVMVGAILTQSTNWANVEKAIANLKKAKSLTAGKISKLNNEKLGKLIRSAGYYNIKAKRLKGFVKWFIDNYSGNIKILRKTKLAELREELLSINGIGPETADSIVLYAAEKPSFVVDAYTRRIFSRHKLIKIDASYEEIKFLFERNLPKNTQLYNEYHALIVKAGKEYCKKNKPLCRQCPIKGIKSRRKMQ